MQTSKVCFEVRDGQVSRLRDVTVKQGEKLSVEILTKATIML